MHCGVSEVIELRTGRGDVKDLRSLVVNAAEFQQGPRGRAERETHMPLFGSNCVYFPSLSLAFATGR